MRASEILRKYAANCGQKRHTARWSGVLEAIDGLIDAKRASLTHIGRALPRAIAAKHRIKRADRLLGNALLHQDRFAWYRSITTAALPAGNIIVLLDWTELANDWYALCATVPFHGRSLPIYAEVHPKSRRGGTRRLRRFLRRLRSLLPPGGRPVVIADAGFSTTFFDACQLEGFDFVVRLRGNAVLRGWNPDICAKAQEFLPFASSRPQLLGQFAVYDSARQGRTLEVVLAPKSPRMRPRRRDDSAYRKRAIEPWVLATSLQSTPATIVALYAKRMRIEETFRDAKNPRFGWSLCYAVAHSAQRLETLLLLTALAMFAVILTGLAAEHLGYIPRLQANTVRTRRVLSVFTVGLLVLAERRHCYAVRAL